MKVGCVCAVILSALHDYFVSMSALGVNLLNVQLFNSICVRQSSIYGERFSNTNTLLSVFFDDGGGNDKDYKKEL